MSTCKKIKVLGVGSYGTVYLGQDYLPLFFSSPPVVFAIKSSELEFSYSLAVEGEILGALKDSPFVVQGLGDDISHEHGTPVYNLMLEYAPGGTLQDLIQSCMLRGGKHIPEFEISWYAYQLLKGIRHVHNHGFVHCDLKPANVLVFPNNCLKLADFGLAKISGGKSVFGHLYRGSLMYKSPESVLYGMHEAPKDIWAIGCMVVELFTGMPIWGQNGNGNESDDLMLKIAFDEPEIPERISFLARDFLKRCFERDPRARWTAGDLLAHPFIISNFLFHNEFSHQMMNTGVKKEDNSWSSYRDLFSTRTSTTPPPGFNQYVVFPNKVKKETLIARLPAYTPECGEDLLLPPALSILGSIIDVL